LNFQLFASIASRSSKRLECISGLAPTIIIRLLPYAPFALSAIVNAAHRFGVSPGNSPPRGYISATKARRVIYTGGLHPV